MKTNTARQMDRPTDSLAEKKNNLDELGRCVSGKTGKLLRKLQLDAICRELRRQCISVTKAMPKIFQFFWKSGQLLSKVVHNGLHKHIC